MLAFSYKIPSHCVNIKFNEIPFTEINFFIIVQFRKIPSIKEKLYSSRADGRCWGKRLLNTKICARESLSRAHQTNQFFVLTTTKTINQRAKN